jgi:hypothetical protein
MADVNIGSNGVLRVNAWLSGGSHDGNYSDVSWELWLVERTAGTFGYNGGNPPIPANVSVNGGQVWSGGFGFDFRAGGQQSIRIASGTTRIGHHPDGSSPGCTVTGYIGSTGTSTIGGPASVSQGVALPGRKVAPGTPTGVTVSRVSDSQIELSWSQSSASNGQPETNDLSRSVNGGPWEDNFVVLSATNSATVSAAPNQKIEYRVRAWNSGAGYSAWSTPSAPIYTTPGAPSGVSAVKNADLDIVVSFSEKVAYSEYEHQVWHGTVAGGVTTWDAAPLATLASGVLSRTHTNPNPAQVHVYRVRAKVGSLYSAYATSSQVQLLTAPGAPTLPSLGSYADKASAFVVPWTHNPIDSTAQKAFEVGYSTNGGTTWSTTGKVTSTTPSRSFAANTWVGDQTVTFRVRTWGQATTGGSDGTGASPWSGTRSVKFKTKPVASVTAPANSAVLGTSKVEVSIGFSQAEGATFVDATITLKRGTTVLETRTTLTQAGTVLNTRVLDGETYTVTATVRDSNGLVSSAVTSTFSVDYLDPVVPIVSATYLEDTGFVQIGLAFPEPEPGQAAAEKLTIQRTINGATETVLEPYPTSPVLTILDTTPTVNGVNDYVVTAISADGSEGDVPVQVVTAERRRAFLSKGPGLSEVVSFGANLRVKSRPIVDSLLVKAAGRSRPIGLYAATGSLTLSVSSELVAEMGSTPEQVENLLLMPGSGCYRDPSGRRIFGLVDGSVDLSTARRGQLSFTISETS